MYCVLISLKVSSITLIKNYVKMEYIMGAGLVSELKVVSVTAASLTLAKKHEKHR